MIVLKSKSYKNNFFYQINHKLYKIIKYNLSYV